MTEQFNVGDIVYVDILGPFYSIWHIQKYGAGPFVVESVQPCPNPKGSGHTQQLTLKNIRPIFTSFSGAYFRKA